jgi:putative membrane protein
MRRMSIVTLALVAAVTIGCNRDNRAENRSPDAVGTTGARDVSNSDKDFVRDLAIAGMAEVELGKLAAEKSGNPEVKKFGQMMIDDHSKASDDLKAVTSKHGITPPTAVDDKHRKLRDDLAGKQGADFDREYMEAMVEGHDDVLEKLEDRIDQQKLAEWKAEMSEQVSGEKRKERMEARTVVPEHSDNPVTMALNEWAASAYPIVYAHRERAKLLENSVKGKNTH